MYRGTREAAYASDGIQLHKKYEEIDTTEFAFEIPEPSKLPTIDQFKEYAQLREENNIYLN